jgi:hypothetical protein
MTSKGIHRRISLLALGLLVCAAPARALEFRMLGWSSPDINLQFDNNQKPVETSVSTVMFSDTYQVAGEGTLTLYKRVEHEGKIIKQTACTVAIPPGLKQGLLLLIPGDDSKALSRKVLPDSQGFITSSAPLIYNYVWFDDSLEARPLGTIQFLNLSRRQIAFQIEEHQLTLAPQAKAHVPLVKGAKRMNFRGAAEVDGRWKIFARKPLATRGPERMIVILRDGPPTNNETATDAEATISMISLFDWPARPESKAAGTPPSLVSSR